MHDLAPSPTGGFALPLRPMDAPFPDRGSNQLRRRRLAPRLVSRAVTAILLAMIAFTGGFFAFAAHVASLDTPASPQKADAIIVLTGGQARLDAAVELLKSGKGKRLLISGVHPDAGSRSLQAATGGDRRLFDCCVDLDHQALDTVGNAEESARWIEAHHYASVILVTNNYHIPRSLLEIRRLNPGAVLTPYPVVNTPLDGVGWLAKPGVLRVMGTEYVKYLAALVRGALPMQPASTDVALATGGGAVKGE